MNPRWNNCLQLAGIKKVKVLQLVIEKLSSCLLSSDVNYPAVEPFVSSKVRQNLHFNSLSLSISTSGVAIAVAVGRGEDDGDGGMKQ